MHLKTLIIVLNSLTGNGTVNFPEFLSLMAKKMRGTNTDDYLMEAFRVFDEDGDGFITAEEIRQVMTSQGKNITDEKVNEMIRNVVPCLARL